MEKGVISFPIPFLSGDPA